MILLLAGGIVNEGKDGKCTPMGKTNAKLPEILPNSYVISSGGCPCAPDKPHFTSNGYRRKFVI